MQRDRRALRTLNSQLSTLQPFLLNFGAYKQPADRLLASADTTGSGITHHALSCHLSPSRGGARSTLRSGATEDGRSGGEMSRKFFKVFVDFCAQLSIMHRFETY